LFEGHTSERDRRYEKYCMRARHSIKTHTVVVVPRDIGEWI
jgi:hypothetical protein